MCKYRQPEKAKDRLKGYLIRAYGRDLIPISPTGEWVRKLQLLSNEYIINTYKGKSLEILITSKRLIISKSLFDIPFKIVRCIYLPQNFKSTEVDKTLNILTYNGHLYKVEFAHLEELVVARNEISKLINIFIDKWEGVSYIYDSKDIDKIMELK